MAGKINFTVIGAGHGGKSMAAHLALMGFPTTLYNRTPEHIAAIKELKAIDLETYEGGPRGIGKLELVTSNIQEALEKAQMIMSGDHPYPYALVRAHETAVVKLDEAEALKSLIQRELLQRGLPPLLDSEKLANKKVGWRTRY